MGINSIFGLSDNKTEPPQVDIPLFDVLVIAFLIGLFGRLFNPDSAGDGSVPLKKRKNPAIPLEIAGFNQVGLAGFEPTTSTTPR